VTNGSAAPSWSPEFSAWPTRCGAWASPGVRALALLQALLAARVAWRLVRSGGAAPIRPAPVASAPPSCVGVLVPVLNEAERLGDCLAGLVAQGAEVGEVLVIDGGSCDATCDLVRTYAARDRRVRLVEAGPAQPGWNGKVWGLHAGEQALAPSTHWVLTIDADVRPQPALARSLVARASSEHLRLLSVATPQRVAGLLEGVVHPALLATLVYRFGRPGTATARPDHAMANGQCCLIRRDLLAQVGGFEAVRDSLCEDVTLARLAAAPGDEVAFYEADGLLDVTMYSDWRETWRNWPRSLATRDRLFGARGSLGLLEVALVQALPLPVLLLGWRSAALRRVNLLLLGVRLGMLVGMARAYPSRPWTYWLSAVADVPAAVALWRSALAREQTWRGRSYAREKGSLRAV
jgi:dolichol-phosphate mannosyltransferase